MNRILKHTRCEIWRLLAEPVPPEPYRLATDVDAALVQKVLYVQKRQRESDVHRHRQADDPDARLEVPEEGGSGLAGKLSARCAPFQRSISNRTPYGSRRKESYDCEAIAQRSWQWGSKATGVPGTHQSRTAQNADLSKVAAQGVGEAGIGFRKQFHCQEANRRLLGQTPIC
jgi:hypothetical protein